MHILPVSVSGRGCECLLGVSLFGETRRAIQLEGSTSRTSEGKRTGGGAELWEIESWLFFLDLLLSCPVSKSGFEARVSGSPSILEGVGTFKKMELTSL